MPVSDPLREQRQAQEKADTVARKKRLADSLIKPPVADAAVTPGSGQLIITDTKATLKTKAAARPQSTFSYTSPQKSGKTKFSDQEQ